MTDERKAEDGDEALPSIYSIGSEKNLVGVKSRATYFKRKKCGSVIILILASLVATLIVAVVVLAVLYSRLHRANAICDSPECVRIAASLTQSMDISVDPCDDFYGYACGRFGAAHRSTKSEKSWFAESTDRNTWIVSESLEKNFTNVDVPKAVIQAKKLYDSCNDFRSIELLGVKPLVSALQRVNLSQTPAGLTGEHGNIVKTVAKVRRIFDRDLFFGVGVDSDPRNRSRNLIFFDVPTSENPLPSYGSEMEKRIKSSRSRSGKLENVDEELSEVPMTPEITYMFKIIRQIVSNGTAPSLRNCSSNNEASKSRDREIKKMAQKIYKLTGKFHDLSQLETNETRDKDVYAEENYMLVDQLQEVTDQYVKKMNSSLVPRKIWRPYIEELFGNVEHLNLSNNRVWIGDLEYLKGVAYILAATDDIELESLIWWTVVDMTVPHASRQLKRLWEEYMTNLVEYEANPSRSWHCASVAIWMMGMAVSWLFVDPEFPTKEGPKVVEMIENMKIALSTTVKDSEWMDERTRRGILEKTRRMSYVVGHPSWLFEEGMLDDQYKGIEMAEDQYLENMITLVAFESARKLYKLFKHNNINDTYWATSPVIVNALHSYDKNHITVPAGILQFPFYGLGLEVLNYGAIGAILGHELTHGFDKWGRLWDKEGTVSPWWTDTAIRQYDEKLKCFIKHYNGYYIDKVGDYVDGTLTINENIADNGGLRQTVLAYKKWQRKHDREPMLPGFTHYTHEQLLFLSFAHMWCENNSAGYLRWRLTDPHCPGTVRILATLRNSPEFSEAWKCPVGSPMNPEKKCKIW